MRAVRLGSCLLLLGTQLASAGRVKRPEPQGEDEDGLEWHGVASDGTFQGDYEALAEAIKGKSLRSSKKPRFLEKPKSAIGLRGSGAVFEAAMDEAPRSTFTSSHKVAIVQRQVQCSICSVCSGHPEEFADIKALEAEVNALKHVKDNTFTTQLWNSFEQARPDCLPDYHYMVVDLPRGFEEKPGDKDKIYDLAALITPKTLLEPEPLTSEEMVLYLAQAACAIFESHRAGVAHLDIRPESFALDGEVWDRPRLAKLLLGEFKQSLVFDGQAAVKLKKEPTLAGPRPEFVPIFSAPELFRKEEQWVVINAKLACERNSDGTKRMNGFKDNTLASCKELCKALTNCVAIDYFTKSGWCNIYDMACTTPASNWDGASSYRLERAVEPAYGSSADWWSFGIMAAGMALGGFDELAPLQKCTSDEELTAEFKKLEPRINRHANLFDLLWKYLLPFDPQTRFSSFNALHKSFWAHEFWTLSGKPLQWGALRFLNDV